jgi:hypothetical protein
MVQIQYKVRYNVWYKVKFLVSEIYTTMLAGLVMDVNLLRIARLFKRVMYKVSVHDTRYKIQYKVRYNVWYKVQYMIQGTGYKVQVRRYKVQGTRNIRMYSTRYKMQLKHKV